MRDLINRSDALIRCYELKEVRRKWGSKGGQAEIRGIDAVMYALHNLPSEQPERKTAYLIDPHPYGKCSICGQLIDIRDEYNFCPKCGAEMR